MVNHVRIACFDSSFRTVSNFKIIFWGTTWWQRQRKWGLQGAEPWCVQVCVCVWLCLSWRASAPTHSWYLNLYIFHIIPTFGEGLRISRILEMLCDAGSCVRHPDNTLFASYHRGSACKEEIAGCFRCLSARRRVARWGVIRSLVTSRCIAGVAIIY